MLVQEQNLHISQIRQDEQDIGNTTQQEKQMWQTELMLRQKWQIQDMPAQFKLIVDLIYLLDAQEIKQLVIEKMQRVAPNNQKTQIEKLIKNNLQSSFSCTIDVLLIKGPNIKLVHLTFATSSDKNRVSLFLQLKKTPKYTPYSKISYAPVYNQQQLFSYYMQICENQIDRLTLLNIPIQFTEEQYESMKKLRLLVKLLNNYQRREILTAFQASPLLNQFYKYRKSAKVSSIIKLINQYEPRSLHINNDTIVKCYLYVIEYIPFLNQVEGKCAQEIKNNINDIQISKQQEETLEISQKYLLQICQKYLKKVLEENIITIRERENIPRCWQSRDQEIEKIKENIRILLNQPNLNSMNISINTIININIKFSPQRIINLITIKMIDIRAFEKMYKFLKSISAFQSFTSST